MKYNWDATCNNCGSYTKKAQCRKAMCMVVDYGVDDNPHCYHWTRSFSSSWSIFSKKVSAFIQKTLRKGN